LIFHNIDTPQPQPQPIITITTTITTRRTCSQKHLLQDDASEENLQPPVSQWDHPNYNLNFPYNNHNNTSDRENHQPQATIQPLH
jgi:hypothetical protein